MSDAPRSAIGRFLDELPPFAVRLLTGAAGRWAAPLGDPEKQRIFYANHASHLDALLVWAMLPAEARRRVRPVAARDYWAGGAIKPWLAKTFRAVLVERKSPSAKKHPLEAVYAALDAGDSLVIFPEGTRSADGTLAPFKSGLHRLAKRAPNADLIPVHLENLNRVLPKGEFLPVPALCFAAFGAPTRLLEGESRDAFLERTRGLIVELEAWQTERRRLGESAPAVAPRAAAPAKAEAWEEETKATAVEIQSPREELPTAALDEAETEAAPEDEDDGGDASELVSEPIASPAPESKP